MRNKVLFLLFCSLLSSCLWFSSQPVYASPVDRQTTGRTAWQHVPLPPPTSTPTPDPKAPVTAMLNKPFTVRIGQWATLANTPEALGVQLYGLVGDSRCPAGVDCIVAGQVEFILIVRQGKTINQERFQLSTNPAKEGNKVAYAGYTIELMGVEPPAPAPDQTLKPSEYIAILVVRAASNSGPTPEPTASQTATPVPQVDEGAAEAVAFNQPFDLLVGETASIHEADFHLTLRSLTEDSGCLSARDCSTMLAEGTLVLAQGEEQELLSFSTSFSAEQAFRYEFAGYVIHLLHVEQTRHGDQVATFMIAPPTVSTELPAPERIDRCPAFSRFDAAAILQEDVQQKAIANLVFGPLAADAQEARGLCGYVSTGFTEPSPNAQTAYLATQVPADHAVAAMLLEGDNVLQLLHWSMSRLNRIPAHQTPWRKHPT